MSYIINSTSPFVSIKLTEKGREKLASGQLNFSYWGIGDSEINYSREAVVDSNPTVAALTATTKVLRPMDQQPNIKYFITPSNNTTPHQVLNPSSINVIKATVNNQAIERGFFNISGGVATTSLDTNLLYYHSQVFDSSMNGSSNFGVGSIVVSSITVGDLMLLKVCNDDSISGNVPVDDTSYALPNLWFKVIGKSGNTITLDRKLPTFNGDVATSQALFYRSGEVYESISTGTTTAYWDSGTLAFQSNNNVTCHDIPVWNMNNVWSENPAGITGLSTTNLYENFAKFGSFPYLGFKDPYSEYPSSSSTATDTSFCETVGSSSVDGITKAISIIHFTNNSISNLYGEFLHIDTTNGKTVEVTIPNLMYHRRSGTTGTLTVMGMKFVASGDTKLVGTSDIKYVDLIEDVSLLSPTTTPKAIGRVYPQLKIIVIDDDEIVAALSYKSNRNWTLPELSAILQSPSGGTSTGVLNVGETMYLTYSLENDKTSPSNGLSTFLSCQKYIKVTNSTSGPKDVAFKIAETDLLSYMRKKESGLYDGLGFHAYKFKLVYQIVSDASIRPDSGAWKAYDFTSTAITGFANETIDPIKLENQVPSANGFVLNLTRLSASTTFDITQSLNMAPNTSPNSLQFGDERFFYGNINTYIGATIYKTIFDVRVNSSQFNSTSNPTRSKDLATNPANIRVSEVGIFDSDKNLVCIGKTSTPVPLAAGTTIMLELSIDF